MTERHDVVVVGAGAAGLTAASALARAGVEMLVAAWSSSQGASSHLAAAVDVLLAGPPFSEADEVTAA